MNVFRLMVVCLLLALGACEQPAPDTPAAAPTASVRVETAALHPMRRTLEAYGTVDYSPQFQRTIDSTAEMVIEQLLVVPGQAVTAGQPLLRVRPTANAALELQRARNDLSATEQELQRTQRMFSQRLATNADMTSARQNVANARASATSAAARIEGEGARVLTTELDAVVASIDVSRGEIVPADTALVHLASQRNLSVRLGVEPADLGMVRAGQPVTVKPIYDATHSVEGTISEVMGQVDNQTRLSQALIDLPGNTRLLPGSTVRAQIEIEHRDSAISVLRSAVLREGAHAFGFVVNGTTAKRVAVEAGLDDGTRIEIVSGLKIGDRVVVEGNYQLEDGMTVSVQAAPMP